VHTLCEFPPELLLQRCRAPTRLILGSRSDRVKPADLAALAYPFPQLDVVTIEGAGHWLHVDQPAQFLAATGLQ
jgi:esterase